MKKSSSEKKVMKKVFQKNNLLADRSNHVLFNASGHIKNGSREPSELSVQNHMLSRGGPPNLRQKKVPTFKSWLTYKASIFGVFDDVGFFQIFIFSKFREKNPGCEKKIQSLNQTG